MARDARRVSVLFLSLLILVAFSTSGTVHALVHHDHHGSDAAWSDIHAALSHEGKNVSMDMPTVWFIVALYAFLLMILLSRTLTRARTYARMRDPLPLDIALRRGCLRYRAFG